MSGTGVRNARSTSSPPTPGQARRSACTMYHHSLPGSLSPRSRETQANGRFSEVLSRHCAARVVLPKPAGASMTTNLTVAPASVLMSSRRATHSPRNLGACSLASTGMPGNWVGFGTGTARRPRFSGKAASLASVGDTSVQTSSKVSPFCRLCSNVPNSGWSGVIRGGWRGAEGGLVEWGWCYWHQSEVRVSWDGDDRPANQPTAGWEPAADAPRGRRRWGHLFGALDRCTGAAATVCPRYSGCPRIMVDRSASAGRGNDRAESGAIRRDRVPVVRRGAQGPDRGA